MGAAHELMTGDLGPAIVVLTVGVLAGMQLQKLIWSMRRDRSSWSRHRRAELTSVPPKRDAVAAVDAADQLRTIMRAEFKPQRLLNKSETRLFKAIDKWVIELRPGWQVMAQVSLGEILKCEDKTAYACINSKRVDLLIVDDECRPLHAIEYQGSGHHQHDAVARDAVKKEALRRAGIGYVEVIPGDTPAELRRFIEKVVHKATRST
jgi:uncharacterized protein DUF2726